jgi:hypothetical protein
MRADLPDLDAAPPTNDLAKLPDRHSISLANLDTSCLSRLAGRLGRDWVRHLTLLRDDYREDHAGGRGVQLHRLWISDTAGITAGPEGNLWFTNYGGGSIGRITPTGTVLNFADPSITRRRRRVGNE